MADRRYSGEDPDNGARASNTAERVVPTRDTSAASEAAVIPDTQRERRQRRAQFLADLAEARELRKRVAPRRTRAAELHKRVLRTFRY